MSRCYSDGAIEVMHLESGEGSAVTAMPFCSSSGHCGSRARMQKLELVDVVSCQQDWALLDATQCMLVWEWFCARVPSQQVAWSVSRGAWVVLCPSVAEQSPLRSTETPVTALYPHGNISVLCHCPQSNLSSNPGAFP